MTDPDPDDDGPELLIEPVTWWISNRGYLIDRTIRIMGP